MNSFLGFPADAFDQPLLIPAGAERAPQVGDGLADGGSTFGELTDFIELPEAHEIE